MQNEGSDKGLLTFCSESPSDASCKPYKLLAYINGQLQGNLISEYMLICLTKTQNEVK